MDETETVALGMQLLWAGALMLALTLIHSLGLAGISRLLRLDPELLKKRSFDSQAWGLMSFLGALLFLLHFVEIFLFAIFYVLIGAIQGMEEAVFFSASTYATIGFTESFPENWRLVGAFEGLIGFILIGWSTAFIVNTMNRLREG
ncbi:ion channel [Sphingomonas xanthus]|uniref:Two pore domain potassium channel family protein n=1 Tax=Sphingomonas xanthus TaxID=2594473 RepID=A0A516IPZ4_9SPHN|nr:ion channel [Sphingomonas xanthus]QDP18982.1 two pore domain potassium channel family protein [Sphingomonas xanthus]